MVGIDETEKELLDAFRECVKDIGYYDDMDELSYEDLKAMYFDIANPIRGLLKDMGFNMQSFGFDTADELEKENIVLSNPEDMKHAVFVMAYDYKGMDVVTAYMPFSKMINNPNWTDEERLNTQRSIVMGLYNGFMREYVKHHTDEEYKIVATDILKHMNVTDVEIEKIINHKE